MSRQLKKQIPWNLCLLWGGWITVFLVFSAMILADAGFFFPPFSIRLKLVLLSAAGLCSLGWLAFISRRIYSFSSEMTRSGQQIKEQNLKLIKKSIELSDVMRKFEDKNYDLELSGARLARTLETLREQERDRRIIFDNSPLGIIRFDTSGSIVDFNDKFVDLMGSTRERLKGFNTLTRSTPEMQAAFKPALEGKVSVFEGPYTSVTGNKTAFFRVVFNPVKPGQSPTQVIATIEDITKRQQAEAQLQQSNVKLERLVKERTGRLIQKIEELKQIEDALRKSEEKYRSILESIEDVYFEADLKGRFVFFNRALPEFLGYSESELYKMNYRTYTDEESRKTLFETFNIVYRTGNASPLIYCHVLRKDGRRLEFSFKISLMKDKQGKATGFQGLARDVTRQRALENRLQHTRKMEAIGSLAGGVAHDFNNILGAVIGYTHLVKKHKDEPERVQSYAQQILTAGERATGLVRQILLFSRETKAQKIPSDLGLVAREVLKLLRASIPSTIDIRSSIRDSLHSVMADQTQIHQVLMNLCSNASHAMASRGGQLEIMLENIAITAKNVDHYFELDLGNYVHLSVSDTGCGMNRETLKKIFDPYFTTKKAGEGTGLGLATVHGIVKDHGGVILVDSRVDQGTVCDIYLPAIDQKIEPVEKPVEIPAGKEKILFVDDEAYLTEVGREMLQDFGYRVDTFTSPKKALKAFKKAPKSYDMVITDYTMPEMTGEKMADLIFEINPRLPVILCTGLTLGIKVDRGRGIKAVLMKPLDMGKLLKTVRETLDLALTDQY